MAILTRGERAPQSIDPPASCLGCGASEAVCCACGVCKHCRNTDTRYDPRTAPPCIVCDRGQPDLARLPWHTSGRWPLGLRARGAP